jgi:phosphoribosylanthranilate isomerase
MPTRVKICGITRPEDAALAAELGADAIGLNFFAGPRKVDFQKARDIQSQLPPLVTRVGLTSGPCAEFPQAPTVSELRQHAGITVVQAYGNDVLTDLTPVDRECLNAWLVLRLTPGNLEEQLNNQEVTQNLMSANALVVDAFVPGAMGGTGEKLNWSELQVALRKTIFRHADPYLILAGGLTPDNVAEAIRIAKPYAVDVSSGVEIPGKPGVKDPVKMRDFIQAAKNAL